MLLTHLKLNSYISRAQWPHAVVATDQTAHLQMPRVSLHSSLPRAATCPILPCLTSVACKLLEFRSQTCALNSCAQSSAYRQTRLHPTLTAPRIRSSPSLSPHSAFGMCSVERRDKYGGSQGEEGRSKPRSSTGAHQAPADLAGVPRCGPLLVVLLVRATFCAACGWERDEPRGGLAAAGQDPSFSPPPSSCILPRALL